MAVLMIPFINITQTIAHRNGKIRSTINAFYCNCIRFLKENLLFYYTHTTLYIPLNEKILSKFPTILLHKIASVRVYVFNHSGFNRKKEIRLTHNSWNRSKSNVFAEKKRHKGLIKYLDYALHILHIHFSSYQRKILITPFPVRIATWQQTKKKNTCR